MKRHCSVFILERRLENLRKHSFFVSCFPAPFLTPVVVWDWQTTTEVFICGERLWCHSHIQIILWLPRAHLILTRWLSKDLKTSVSLMSFANICKCVLVCTYCMCLDLCVHVVKMVVISEAGFGWALHKCMLRATLHSSAVETYRIKGLRRKRVTAGGVVLQ